MTSDRIVVTGERCDDNDLLLSAGIMSFWIDFSHDTSRGSKLFLPSFRPCTENQTIKFTSQLRLLTFFHGHWQLVNMITRGVLFQADKINMNLAQIEFGFLLENNAP